MRLSALSRWVQPSPISNLALLLSAGALGSGLPTWIQARVSTVLESQLLEVTGAQAAPQLTALAVVALLAGLALRLGRRGLRYLLATVLLLAGAGLVAASAGVLANPQAAAAHQVNGVTGTTAAAQSYALTLWPWATILLGSLLVLLALVALATIHQWPQPASYDRAQKKGPSPAASQSEELDEIDAWDSLTRGQDPTDS